MKGGVHENIVKKSRTWNFYGGHWHKRYQLRTPETGFNELVQSERGEPRDLGGGGERLGETRLVPQMCSSNPDLEGSRRKETAQQELGWGL